MSIVLTGGIAICGSLPISPGLGRLSHGADWHRSEQFWLVLSVLPMPVDYRSCASHSPQLLSGRQAAGKLRCNAPTLSICCAPLLVCCARLCGSRIRCGADVALFAASAVIALVCPIPSGMRDGRGIGQPGRGRPQR